MLSDILIPLVAVGLAELGDKTQLSILLLSSKTKKHMHLLLGVMLAFLIVDGAAILAGSWIAGAVPYGTLKLVSGAVFIMFGALILRNKEEGSGESAHSKNPFLSGFTLILATEMGDKTQIAAGLFATKYNAIAVLAGAMMALAILSVMAIYLGKKVLSKVETKVMTKVAGTVFILMGVAAVVA